MNFEASALGMEFADGEAICRQGEQGNCMYVVLEGRVVVLREEDGTEILMGELAVGDVFGEMAIFDRQPRSATVRAKGSTRALALDRRAFLRAVHEDPSVAFWILERMSARIRKLDDELAWLKRRP